MLVVELFRALDNNGVPGDWAPVAHGAVTGTIAAGALIDSPPVTNSYWYRIQVFDRVVNSATSNELGPVAVEPLIWAAPEGLSPADGSTNVSTTPTLSWAAVTGVNKYWVMFAAIQSDLPTDIAADDCEECLVSIITTDTSYTPSIALANGTTFFWQVQAFNDVDTTTKQGFYTPVTNFSTVTTMATLTLYIHDGAGGSVLEGVLITGTDATGTPFSETTNASGFVTITGTAGDWDFTVVKSGFTNRSWIQSIVVTGDVHAFM
ncbi:MAG: hypothetical protein O6922_01845 [Chloroflexi bacterium]|nr:hypothetical protein [Chloroflexota bacterium]